QRKKRDLETEEDDEEFDANLTIVGGKSTEWIVNGIKIRERLKEYQLKKNLPKTRPEYYDIIFFNSNSNKDGFLESLDETSAKDKNSLKEDSERRSTGKKIDTIIELREENQEFSVIEI
ncbi:16687_t:CDS:2, partial [Acaulospora colombiana]